MKPQTKIKQSQTKLREAIRLYMLEALATGSTTPGRMADHLMDHHPELVGDLGHELTRAALVDLCRTELRKRKVITRASAMQYELPVELQALDLPAVISIPRGELSDDEGEDVEWMDALRATLGQGLRHLELLEESIRRDTARRDDWRALCDFVSEKTDGDLDAIIGAVLASERQGVPA